MKQIRMLAVVENLSKALEFLDRELIAMDCPEEQRTMFDIVAEEIFANIVFYAYHQLPGEVEIGMETDKTSGQVTVYFSDQGFPYNPLEKPDPDISLSAVKRSIGGLGIFMVKKSMDQVTYEYREGRNLLTLKKKIQV